MTFTATRSKEWLIAPAASPDYLRRYRGLHPIVAQVLINRGYDDPKFASEFLYSKTTTHNPFDMPDMAKAVGRIRQAIRFREPIVVYGDFDADGVTSTTLLVYALHTLGARVQPYIPHRIDEGYGLNSPALQEIAKRGVKLVITVDCGIRSIEEVEDAKSLNLDIIITDHHSLGPELPDAYAVVNCKREGYPEPMLAGVGVAFKLTQALAMAERQNKRGRQNKREKLDVSDLLDLVALGTVADMMPLNHMENRVFVRRGLEALNKTNRAGLRALIEVSGLEMGKITASNIGYALAPRINAAGRLDDAMIAYKLLSATNMNEAREWAHVLQELNTRRQDVTRAAQDTIREQLEETEGDSPLIFAAHEGFLPGIVGLVAGRLTEAFFRPAIVMEKGETESRASCRSIPQFDITGALDQCADLLVRHGGHALAAGFTVINENIPALRERLTALAIDKLGGKELVPTLEIDALVDVHQLDEVLVESMGLLEPCGNGNPVPLFAAQNIHVAEYRTVGKDNRHLKLRLSRAGQPSLDAIAFGLGEWANEMPQRIDVAFQLEINEWNGRRNIQANVQDIRPAEAV